MSDSPFELNVDSDWKKQAQEEKRRLAEEAEKSRQAVAPAATPSSASPASPAAPTAGRRRGRATGPANFQTLVQSLASQISLYLGAIPVQNGEGIVDLDTAKQNLDLLAVLEDKTSGNLNDTEQAALDIALYEARSRFASVASRYIL